MQITSYLVATFAAITLALPGTTTNTEIEDYIPTPEDAAIFNQTLPELEKRGHYGWFASFATADRGCLKGFAPPRPKVTNSDCIPFHPLQNRIKVFSTPSPTSLFLFYVPPSRLFTFGLL